MDQYAIAIDVRIRVAQIVEITVQRRFNAIIHLVVQRSLKTTHLFYCCLFSIILVIVFVCHGFILVTDIVTERLLPLVSVLGSLEKKNVKLSYIFEKIFYRKCSKRKKSVTCMSINPHYSQRCSPK